MNEIRNFVENKQSHLVWQTLREVSERKREYYSLFWDLKFEWRYVPN